MDGGNVIFKFNGDDKGLQKTISGLGKVGKVALATFATGLAAVTTGFVSIAKASVEARAEVEQSIGGVETLFKEHADFVIENAKNAYKTAGVSANEYMQGVNSFAASLISSTAGNTRKAAEVADMAFKDMSDNANKFGSDMASIQNAYQGFAKQNYTMLDNLKLGYGGTKTEMQRLLKDAQKLTGIKYNINNLSDVYNAIHAIQEELGITGTTAQEAEKTFTGSFQSMKAAWDNFLGGTGDLGQVADATGIFIDNLTRILDEALPQIAAQLEAHAPQILELVSKVFDIINNAFDTFGPQISEITVQIMGITAQAMLSCIPTLLLTISDMIGQLLLAITEANTKFWTAALTWVANLAGGIMAAIGQVLLAIANVCTSVVSAVLGFVGRMLQAGWELIKSIGEGISKGASNAMSALRNVLSKIWEAIKGKFTEVKNNAGSWGKDMMTGFINGIMGKLNELRERVRQIADNIRAQLHFSRPDEGPLRDYETWMPDMIKGMAASLDKAAPILTDKVRALTMDMSPTINGSYGSYQPNVNVVVNNSYETDPLGQMVNTIKTFSNGAKNDYNYGYGG